MDTIEEPIASSHIGEARTRTPAYASFDSNTDKLLHLFKFISRGVKNFTDELKTTVDPQIARLCAEIATLGGRQDNEANDQVTDRDAHEAESAFSAPRQGAEIAREISEILG